MCSRTVPGSLVLCKSADVKPCVRLQQAQRYDGWIEPRLVSAAAALFLISTLKDLARNVERVVQTKLSNFVGRTGAAMSWSNHRQAGASVAVPLCLNSIPHAHPVEPLCQEWWNPHQLALQPADNASAARWPAAVSTIDHFTDISLWPSGTATGRSCSPNFHTSVARPESQLSTSHVIRPVRTSYPMDPSTLPCFVLNFFDLLLSSISSLLVDFLLDVRVWRDQIRWICQEAVSDNQTTEHYACRDQLARLMQFK
jgi:hypothetical protein